MADSKVFDRDSPAPLPERAPAPTPAPPAMPPTEPPDLLRRLDEALAREHAARRALDLMVTILDALPVGLTVQSDDGRTLFTNETAAAFFAATPLSAAARSENRKSDAVVSEDSISGPDGERTFLKSCRTTRILDRNLLLSASLDFTERKRIETELAKRAHFDDLTGLPNRALIQDHVELLLAKPGEQRRFALAFIDIDNFKHINDYYTHAIGDALLVKVAQRVAAQVRRTDVVGRISGDEFLLVIEPVSSDIDLALIIDRILQELKEPFLIEGYEILTSASIGVSVYPDHGRNYETLRRAADTAMYRIKADTKGGAALFNSEMGRDMTVHMAQEQRLRLAVRDGAFCCAFQPKVDMRTGEVAGVEALIRLRDADGLIQAPGEFIGLAVKLGLIDDMTYLALEQILKSMDLIDETFGPQVTVSVNVAAQQASDFEFMRDFCREIGSSGYAERFVIEVTEDAFLAKNHFQSRVLPMLREARLRVSIDDFGTGYSSLAQLADITADELKIDRSFITAIHQRSRSQSILKAIEALSDSLGMTVVAEGVETEQEAAFLQAETRIRYAQGFYYSKPIFMEELTPLRGSAFGQRGLSSPRERSVARGGSFARR